MRYLRALVLAATSLLLAFTIDAAAQQPSLAELARQQRAQRSSAQKKVYTNEDIPAPSISGTPAEPAAEQAEQKEAPKEDAAAAKQPTPEEQEKEYRDKFAKLKEDLDMQERKLDVLQRELNLMQQQFYSDPNQQLQQELTRENINKRVEDIEAQKGVVEKAKQAIADLETELQRKGLPAGWAR